MPVQVPLNTAHQHTANAEDFLGQGLLIPAAQEHRSAAEAYLAAHACASEESAKRTLKLLHNEHNKAANELERKIDLIKAAGGDPSLPQKFPPTPSRTTTQTINEIPRSPHSPSPEKHLGETVDESFMILPGHKSDPKDSFNQFWNVMQQALDNHLPQTVAFATIPLGDQVSPTTSSRSSGVREGSSSSDTDQDDPIVSRITKRIQGMSTRFHQQRPEVSSKLVTEIRPPDYEDEPFDDGDELSESFTLIPPASPDESSLLEIENKALKAEIAMLRQQVIAADQSRKAQQGHLRESIYQATREAHRTLLNRPAASGDQASLSTTNTLGVQTGREAQYVRRVQELDRRVKELEDDLRAARTESDRYKAMYGKFKERWDKLKESARRKKEAKGQTQLVNQRIEEDPEAEARLDGAP